VQGGPDVACRRRRAESNWLLAAAALLALLGVVVDQWHGPSVLMALKWQQDTRMQAALDELHQAKVTLCSWQPDPTRFR
jgi:glycine cleavage system pyridoxal-binding protein P